MRRWCLRRFLGDSLAPVNGTTVAVLRERLRGSRRHPWTLSVQGKVGARTLQTTRGPTSLPGQDRHSQH
ncbi:hypothetical protein NDU88_003102 [Pleurodeles waltl]|uniref:Uncharacterized protein n=1 Tax=Pleurodeles waltl TaxID=8319 RepID=A0AAV7LG59_PLEWA|nr:hypothetical protein NDU88_003102 [Pleurodeles waltl]